MTTDVEEIRPAVISEDTQKGLIELLAFRYVVTSVYGYELDAKRNELLIELVLNIYPAFRKEIENFCNFLNDLQKKL